MTILHLLPHLQLLPVERGYALGAFVHLSVYLSILSMCYDYDKTNSLYGQGQIKGTLE